MHKLLKSIAVAGLCASTCSGSNLAGAQRIHRILVREGSKVPVTDIKWVLDEIDRNLALFFPRGPFTKSDLIAIAMTESRFNRHCVGTSGERGVFQVMPGYHHAGDLSAIPLNTRLAFLILRQKLKEHKDKRRAIIAYNGFKIYRGKLRDSYWIAVNKQRQRIKDLS